ncbi:Putative uncharacterized protein [Lacticaseibacillus paracasei]|nr:Putative uncharacterized protein [Lacticaseibacillus paracasei]
MAKVPAIVPKAAYVTVSKRT